MEMPRLTPEHEALSMLVGSWQGAERIHPSGFDPVGGQAIGRVAQPPGVGRLGSHPGL